MISESELILNQDGSVYHLNLLPEHLADTVITVGDPDRVNNITKHFDSIEFTIKKREFHTQTGYCNGKRLSVISTGIGTDNIDIVLNELDALVNINLKTREVNDTLKSLDIVRIGTSGTIQDPIPIDSFIVSETAIGFDTLLHYYDSAHIQETSFSEALVDHLQLSKRHSYPYVVKANAQLLGQISSDRFTKGVTATNVGFYAPQGRVLRAGLSDVKFMSKLRDFRFQGQNITNLEMETAGIYGMANLLGHRAVSLNAILANRMMGAFSKNPQQTIDNLIVLTLNKLTT